jgi:hypothetical protein
MGISAGTGNAHGKALADQTLQRLIPVGSNRMKRVEVAEDAVWYDRDFCLVCA